MSNSMSKDFDLALAAYLEKLTSDYAAKAPTLVSTHKYEAMWGQKFIRIVSNHKSPNRDQRSSHSFIVKVLFLLLAIAGWYFVFKA